MILKHANTSHHTTGNSKMNNTSPKVPPQALNVERSVLGSMLIDSDALDTGIEMLSRESFYSTGHQLVFNAIVKVFQQSTTPDVLTLSEFLQKTGELDAVGTESYLFELVESVVTSSNISALCKILEDKRRLRELAATALWLSEQSYMPSADSSALVDLTEARVYKITRVDEVQRWYHPSEIVPVVKEGIEKCRVSGVSAGLMTGFDKLDSQISGFQPQDLVIVAGRPGMGKTSFALNVAMNVSKCDPKATVAVFSMEMSKVALVQRMLCAEARIQMKRLRAANMSKEERERVMENLAVVENLNIEIDDTGLQTPMQQRAKMRRLAKKKNIVLVIGDYLQLMADSEKHQNRQAEVTAISRSLKMIAKEFDVPYMALSQLSRACEMRGKDNRPMLSDLRESGAIEQDADIVLFTYRDEMYNKGDPKVRGIGEIIIGKQRNGATGTVRLAYESAYMRFDNLATKHEQEAENEQPDQHHYADEW